jgi:hypothetical protein
VHLRLFRVLAAFAGFSFLLHFVWEMLQAPLYSSARDLPHVQGIWICTRAAIGDVGIALSAYACAAAAQRTSLWVMRPRPEGWSAYLVFGLLVTVAFEHLGTGALQRWAYGGAMPTLPVLGTGLAPVLQWLLVPPLAAWLTARQG